MSSDAQSFLNLHYLVGWWIYERSRIEAIPADVPGIQGVPAEMVGIPRDSPFDMYIYIDIISEYCQLDFQPLSTMDIFTSLNQKHIFSGLQGRC